MKKDGKSSNLKLAFLKVGLILLFSGATWYSNYQADIVQAKKPIKYDSTSTVSKTLEEPSESSVSKDDFKNIPAGQPREIIFSTINVTGYIQKMGIDQNDRIAAPDNINLAGWYTGSAKPGDTGLSIIDGHSGGRYNDGIFKRLNSLNANDTFVVVYGDDSTRTFRVLEKKTLQVDEAVSYLFQKDSDVEKQLNLITCGDQYNESTKLFDTRVVVKSEAIP